MNSLQNLIKERSITKTRSYRNELLEMFRTELSSESYRVYTGRGVAMKMSHVKTGDLKEFYQECQRYRKKFGSFGKYWNGRLKVKNIKI